MSTVLEKYAAELRKLSAEELSELSAWLADHLHALEDEPARRVSGVKMAWPDFGTRARQLSFLDTLLEARASRF